MKNQTFLFSRFTCFPIGIYHLTIILYSIFIFLSCNKTNPVANNDNTTLTDVEGNVYQTVKIGNQVWMAENLRATKYNDGTLIPVITDSSTWSTLTSSGCRYYNNMTNSDSIKKYGALYNWYAINDNNRIAPSGWHIPSDSEWYTLENYLIANGYNYNLTTTGNKIAKSMSAKTDWLMCTDSGVVGNNLTRNNRSGFSALPSGCFYGHFSGIGGNCVWWTDTKVDTSLYIRVLSYALSYLIKDSCSLNMQVGASLRLIKDN